MGGARLEGGDDPHHLRALKRLAHLTLTLLCLTLKRLTLTRLTLTRLTLTRLTLTRLTRLTLTRLTLLCLTLTRLTLLCLTLTLQARHLKHQLTRLARLKPLSGVSPLRVKAKVKLKLIHPQRVTCGERHRARGLGGRGGGEGGRRARGWERGAVEGGAWARGHLSARGGSRARGRRRRRRGGAPQRSVGGAG